MYGDVLIFCHVPVPLTAWQVVDKVSSIDVACSNTWNRMDLSFKRTRNFPKIFS